MADEAVEVAAAAGVSEAEAAQESGGGAPSAPARRWSKPQRTGKKRCRGCGKLLDEDETNFPSNSVFCWPDKRALDVIAKQARAQSKTAWFSRVRADDVLVRRLLLAYKEKLPTAEEPSGGKRTRSSFSLLEYIESLTAFSKAEVVVGYQMMWRGKYLDWAQSVDGGKLTEEEAHARWQA